MIKPGTFSVSRYCGINTLRHDLEMKILLFQNDIDCGRLFETFFKKWSINIV